MTERVTDLAPTPPEPADALLARLEARLAAGEIGCSREDGLALHALAVQAARGHGVFEVAIGEGLDRILRRGGLPPLGRSGIGDLGREDLGLSDGQARRLRRNAAALRFRPLLCRAILAGEVSSRKAEVLLGRTRPDEDAYWTERAKHDSVRRLETALRRRKPTLDAAAQEEDWTRVEQRLPPEHLNVVRAALAMAGILEPNASHLRKIEMILMEFLGEFGLPPGEAPAEPEPGSEPAASGEASPGEEAADVGREPAADPDPPDATPFDPCEVLKGLQALVRERSALDERLRRACLLARDTRAWAWAGFCKFGAWCSEALGLSPRTVRQLISLERKLQALPPLREAVREHTLSLEQARQVARHASIYDVHARIAEAAARPALDTRRQADAEDERRMWDASKLTVSLPERVATMFRDALIAGQHHFPGLTSGQIVVCIAAHANFTWDPEVERVLKTTDKVILRDRWRCQIPGCSHPAEHVHHVRYRSRGGCDEEWNLVSLCAAHHLQGVHMGYIHISGTAPDGLTFIVGKEAILRARAAGPPAKLAA